MPRFFRPHILLTGHTQTFPFTSNQTGRGIKVRSGVDAKTHGRLLRAEFKKAVDDFTGEEEREIIYVTFLSEYDFLLDVDKWNDSNGHFRVAAYKEIKSVDNEGEEHVQVQVTVALNKQAVSIFLKKINEYIHKRSRKKSSPLHQPLMANLREIRAATLQSFWMEPELPFPDPEVKQWWEVWLSRNAGEMIDKAALAEWLPGEDILIGERELLFPENQVFLVQARAEQLAGSLLYADRLAELRRPVETADYFTTIPRAEQQEWITDLRSRLVNYQDQSTISVCLLDTGVNRNHPLLAELIEADELDTVQQGWTTSDSVNPYGHGTPMAGLCFFGDLTDAFNSTSPVEIFHRLESIKLIEDGEPHQPALYGAITQEAVGRGVIIHRTHKRIVCLTVTSRETQHYGRPTSWSSAIDQMLYNESQESSAATMLFVSAGNLPMVQWPYSPIANDEASVNDPGQTFNGLTVGAYTLKDAYDRTQYAHAELLARRMAMAPCNTTSVGWDKEWCKKPDIVMEGGNAALENNAVLDLESLQMLSIGKGGLGTPPLTTFGQTSGATALASRFAAELWFRYPHYWPETIRGLMVHSASWTRPMLGDRRITQLTSEEKKRLLERVGYGVPHLQRALQSANNSLTLIAQRTLKPYKFDDSRVKTDEFHLFDLPWPVEALQQIFAQEVQLLVTLSYYIEPNPGSRHHQKAASYRNAGLRFKMNDRGEGVNAFKARVSRAMKDDDYQKEGNENWVLGSSVRDKGCLHKDVWIGTAADLAAKNKIAVYPVGGWWKSRKKLARYHDSIRYSLIVTIVTPDIAIDIYTPVENLISVSV